MKIICNVLIKVKGEIVKREMTFTLEKDTPLMEVDNKDECIVLMHGQPYIIDRGYKHMVKLQKEL